MLKCFYINERLPEESNRIDFINNPIIIKNNTNNEMISEKVLQKLIMEDISSFLKELDFGFTYIDNKYVIKYKSDKKIISREYELV